MIIIENELSNKVQCMAGPGLTMALFIYFDSEDPLDFEDFDDGEIYERFMELDGNAINQVLKHKATQLKQYIKYYVEANDLYIMLPSGNLQPQIEMEVWN